MSKRKSRTDDQASAGGGPTPIYPCRFTAFRDARPDRLHAKLNRFAEVSEADVRDLIKGRRELELKVTGSDGLVYARRSLHGFGHLQTLG